MRSSGHRTQDTSSADPAGAILHERARALARPLERAVDDQRAVLTFTVAGSRYAVEIDQVREVLARPDISRLPWVSPVLAGVTNVRGAVVAVVDTARLLGLGDAPASGAVVVLEGAGVQPLGLLVDVVDDVSPIAAGSIVPPPEDVRQPTAELILGVTPSAVVLDARALLSDPRLMNEYQEGT